MANRAIHEWSTTPSENDFPPVDGGWVEGMSRREVNDSNRGNLAALRSWYNDPEWIVVRIQGPDAGDVGTFNRISATQFQIDLAGVDLRPFFQDGRIIKIVDGGGAGVDLVTQVSGTATYSDPLTTVNIRSTDSMNAAASDAQVFHSSIIRALALLDSNAQFYVPATADSAGINAAIMAADAAGGGVVLLTESVYNLEAQIDLTTYGDIRLMGTGHETVLRQNAAAAIDPLVTVGNASEGTSFENVQFDMNGNGGTIVEISGALRPRFDHVVFNGGETQVEYTSTLTQNSIFTRCFFTNFTHYGIVVSGPTDTHNGQIQSCLFQPASVMAIADPACIKVAGQWVIDGNRLNGVGDASRDVRGIWLWNETASNGGRRCVVSANIIAGTSTNGIMLEIGGDEIACSGNRISCNSGQTGISVNGVQAGQTIVSVNITGNTVIGGSPLIINQRAFGIVVAGNNLTADVGNTVLDSDGDSVNITGNFIQNGAIGVHLRANGTQSHLTGNFIVSSSAQGIEIEGDLATVIGNRFVGAHAVEIRIQATADRATIIENLIYATATTGIEIVGAANLVRILRNLINGATTGILIPVATTGVILKDNEIISATTPINDSGVETNRLGNTSDVIGVDPVSTAGNDFPDGNSGGRYLAVLQVTAIEAGSGGSATVQLRIGPLGTTSDPVAVSHSASVSGFSGSQNSGTQAYIVTAAAGDQYSVSTISDVDVQASGSVAIFKLGI